MRRSFWMLLCMLLLMPRTSLAIQLHWYGGATNLTATQNTQAVLVVSADSAEVTLPNSWHLSWTADTVNVAFSQVGNACLVDTAKVDSVALPATAADSAANQSTAYFCSSGGSNATTAYFVATVPAGGHGKIKVVALNPADSTRVIQSNTVTFNGGVGGNFPPTILSATDDHSSSTLEVTLIGADLDSVTAVRVGTDDALWDVPLLVTAQSDTTLAAYAVVAASLPAAVVTAVTDSGACGEATLPADPDMSVQVSQTASDTILYVDPRPRIYPKDFAFFVNSVPIGTNGGRKGLYHLFYISAIRSGYPGAFSDSTLTHAWCDTLGGAWTVDTTLTQAFRPSGSGWDAKKCWAPSMQQVGGRTYMFYTGVDASGNQSIGYAYTDSLFTTNIPWHRSSTPIYTPMMTSWADTIGHESTNKRAFRDPFVMPDPDPAFAGRYLMFVTGEDRNYTTHYTVGVARNEPQSLNTWKDVGNYIATDHNHFAVPGAVESPMVVRDSLTGAWRMFVANASYVYYNSTYFLTEGLGDSLTDTRAASWPGLDSLYYYEGNDDNLIGWEAPEHLQIGPVHLFAAYNGNGIGITRAHWDTTAHKFVFVKPTNASVSSGTPGKSLRFYVSNLRPGAGVVHFVVDSPSAMTARLVVYDVTGRIVREVASGQRLTGRCELAWNCRDGSGRRVPTGMYFGRLTGAASAKVARVPIVR